MTELTTISPITSLPILTRPSLTPSSIPALVTTARQAFESFQDSHPTLADRKPIIRKFLDLLLEKKDEIAKEITETMGRPIRYTAGEVGTAVKRAEFMLRISDEVLKDEVSAAEDCAEGEKKWITKEAHGVALAVFAWNVSALVLFYEVELADDNQYPWLILINSLIPALLAGNAIIIKPSPQTPTVADTAVALLEQAGLPKGVAQAIHCGDPEIIQSLVTNPEIDVVTFTGSVQGGIAIQKAAAERTVPVILELGGKDPAYIRPDVDIAYTAGEVVDGALFNSGQSCCAIERVYVHESIHDQFVEEVKKVLKGYVLGDPRKQETMLGPVVSKASVERVKAQVDDAVKKGAKVETPEGVFGEVELDGWFVRPELLTGCTHDMGVLLSLLILGHLLTIDSNRCNERRNLRSTYPSPKGIIR